MNSRRDEVDQHVRERTLYRYTCAVERGDLGTVADVVALAELDRDLERMIVEVNNILSAEEVAEAHAADASLVRSLLAIHLPSAMAESQEELQDLSIGVVAAQMQVDASLHEPLALEIRAQAQRLTGLEERLPDDLSQRRVRQFFDQLGISTSDRFRALFRETAILLALGKGQSQAQLDAARRHQQRTPRQEERQEDSNGSQH